MSWCGHKSKVGVVCNLTTGHTDEHQRMAPCSDPDAFILYMWNSNGDHLKWDESNNLVPHDVGNPFEESLL